MSGDRRGGDPGPVPPRWLNCPRKSSELIAGKFLALKTPLDQRYDPQLEPQFRFSPQMLFQVGKLSGWIFQNFILLPFCCLLVYQKLQGQDRTLDRLNQHVEVLQ